MSQTVQRAVLYTRVSTDQGQQDPQSQRLALQEACAQRGFRVVSEHGDRVTGDPDRRRHDPPGLCAALRQLEQRKADVLVVFSACRLVRSPAGLLQLVERVHAYGGRILSLREGRDLDTTQTGELLTFMLGWMARQAMLITRERTIAGLQRVRAEGRTLGRPRVELTEAQRDEVLLRLGLEQPVRQIARETAISRRQVLRVQEWLTNGGPQAGAELDGKEGG